jgi:anti-sigma regulatory factor (Ser/Thr protein kinase)
MNQLPAFEWRPGGDGRDETSLPAGPAAPAVARAAISDHLKGRLDSGRLNDVLLAVSELVTNAVRHASQASGRADVAMAVARSDQTVRIAVTDCAPGDPPRMKPTDAHERGGLGLLLVESLSERWGVERRGEATKEVWFEVRVERASERHLLGPLGTGLRRVCALPVRTGLAIPRTAAMLFGSLRGARGEPEAQVREAAFKCPACGYELRTHPKSAKYECPRCSVPLGPRRVGSSRR